MVFPEFTNKETMINGWEHRHDRWNIVSCHCPISTKRNSQSAAAAPSSVTDFLHPMADERPRRLNRRVARKERHLSPVLSIDDRWRPVRERSRGKPINI